MIDDKDKLHPTHQPRRPVRGLQHYKELKQEITQQKSENRKSLFSMTIDATTKKGEFMNNSPSTLKVNEQQFIIDIVFKPIEPGLRLRPEESQLLMNYIAEMLKEIEEEEKLVIAEEKAVQEKGNKASE